jgi:uncharacterized protein YegP (UPF0339 family)
MTVSSSPRQARPRKSRTEAPRAKSPEKRMKFVVYEDNSRQWRWRLVTTGGSVLADSGRHYGRRNDALGAVQRIQSSAAGAELSAS